MNDYYYRDNREIKESVQAQCRRLEKAGYKIFSVQYSTPDYPLHSLNHFDLQFRDFRPKITVFY